jgi:hypothetical protein
MFVFRTGTVLGTLLLLLSLLTERTGTDPLVGISVIGTGIIGTSITGTDLASTDPTEEPT